MCAPLFLLPGMKVKGFYGSSARKLSLFPQFFSAGGGTTTSLSVCSRSFTSCASTHRNCPPPAPFIRTLRLVLPTAAIELKYICAAGVCVFRYSQQDSCRPYGDSICPFDAAARKSCAGHQRPARALIQPLRSLYCS